MACISTIDAQTRLDVQQLLNQFVYFLDKNDGVRWADLFTIDGVFEFKGSHYLTGKSDLVTLPAVINKLGGGAWRHLPTALIVERLNSRNELSMSSYCIVLDTHKQMSITNFYDLKFTLRFSSRWRISHAIAIPVGISNNLDLNASLAMVG